MTIPVCDLIACVDANINAVTTCELTFLQLSSVTKDFDRSWVKSVDTVASLPDATLNKGRMIYVQSVCGYRISDGVTWSNDFTSTLQDFQIWSWGNNNNGLLGNGTTSTRSSPVSVVGGFTDWCQVSAGSGHMMAVRTGGTAWAWGNNQCGRLGDNTTTNKSSPVSVVGGFTDWCQVSAGGQHSVAVRSSGSAWAWGRNYTGQLGNNTTTNESSPVSVVGGFSDWCAVNAASGGSHTLAVRSNGTAWAWGCNSGGRLGDNTTTPRSSPVSVVGGFTDWCQVSAGNYHSVAVRRGGSVWAWGCNSYGQIGDNSSSLTDRSSPVSVVGGFTDWCQASAGNRHNVAVRSSGSSWAWGRNQFGQLGNNTTTNQSSPVSVVGGFTNWCQVSAGGSFNVAVRTVGSAWAWGYNNSGTLGNNTTTNQSSPVSVVGGFTDWYQVSAGENSSAALNATRGFA